MRLQKSRFRRSVEVAFITKEVSPFGLLLSGRRGECYSESYGGSRDLPARTNDGSAARTFEAPARSPARSSGVDCPAPGPGGAFSRSGREAALRGGVRFSDARSA